MNQNSNQRCSCFCRPQMPAPPCMNTDCGCDRCQRCDSCNDQPAIPSPLIPPAPQARPPMPPVQTVPQTQGTSAAGAPVLPPRGSTAASDTNISGSCDCGSGNPLVPNFNINQFPIGMGYVPWQRWGQTYPVEQGFSRGTIFPQLDLPFVMGRCR